VALRVGAGNQTQRAFAHWPGQLELRIYQARADRNEPKSVAPGSGSPSYSLLALLRRPVRSWVSDPAVQPPDNVCTCRHGSTLFVYDWA